MTRRLVAAVAFLLAGCPSLPPPAPRARARLVSLERAGTTGLRARLAVSLEGHAFTVAAVDWELALPGGPPLLRGRSDSLDLAIAVPPQLAPELAAASRVRLRGAIHMRDRRAAAAFDLTAPLR